MDNPFPYDMLAVAVLVAVAMVPVGLGILMSMRHPRQRP